VRADSVSSVRKSPLNYGDLSTVQQTLALEKGVEINERKAVFLLLATRCLALLAGPTKQAVLRLHAAFHCGKPFSWRSSTTKCPHCGLPVDEKQHAKEAAKGSYFPSIRNDSSFCVSRNAVDSVTPAAWVQRGEPPIPPVSSVLNRGAAA